MGGHPQLPQLLGSSLGPPESEFKRNRQYINIGPCPWNENPNPNADAFFWADIRLSSGFTFNDIADFL